LRLLFASCQHYEQGLYTAYQHMALEDGDLVVHLGDYIYEGAPSRNGVRVHYSPLCMRLDDYRLRYAQYKTDEHLRAAHVARPWIVTWDDHEVSNNYAGLIAADTGLTIDVMRHRRAAAYQAWWEHQPVRLPASRDWANLTITRTMSWGALAQLWVMDTRQYRSDQACGDGTKQVPCGEWADPSRTMMGAHDIHSNWVNELRSSFSRPGAPTIGAEFVGTSISSGGDGTDRWPAFDALAPENPHIQWQNSRRGYVSCQVSSGEWRADYRTVPFVSQPGAPVVTASSWRVAHGVAGIERI
jgi:phosphodiesterase/alkaline phosphatase D-like protein